MIDKRMVNISEGSDVVRLEDGCLAGSIMTMDKAISNFINHTETSLKDTIRMATYNPAVAIGMSNKKGEIKSGMDADITVFSDDLDIKLTIVEGKIEYSKL